MLPEPLSMLRRTSFHPASVIEAGGRWLSHLGRPVKDVFVINGHPDPSPGRFCAALCSAYERGARKRVTHRLNVGAVVADNPQTDWDEALELIRWSGTVVIVYPLWLDRPPSALNGLIAKTLEAGLLGGGRDSPLVRTIVTMDMPAFAHRALGRKPGRTTLNGDALPGIAVPTYIGCVDRLNESQRLEWLDKVRALGESDA